LRFAVWTCTKPRAAQCGFFIWVDDEAEAKEWLEKNPPSIAPETPINKGSKSGGPEPPKEKETPWTKSKRKPISRELSDENENGSPSKLNDDDMQEVEETDTPSRKAPKKTRFSTPGQSFIEKLKNDGVTIPTPESGDRHLGDASTSRPRDVSSPIPIQLENAIFLNDDRRSDLAARVLSLIRSEKVNFRDSTLARIRHEIEMEVDLNDAKLRRYNETITELSRKLDEKERQLLEWIGDATINETIELSD
jgi:hypothetical protein